MSWPVLLVGALACGPDDRHCGDQVKPPPLPPGIAAPPGVPLFPRLPGIIQELGKKNFLDLGLGMESVVRLGIATSEDTFTEFSRGSLCVVRTIVSLPQTDYSDYQLITLWNACNNRIMEVGVAYKVYISNDLEGCLELKPTTTGLHYRAGFTCWVSEEVAIGLGVDSTCGVVIHCDWYSPDYLPSYLGLVHFDSLPRCLQEQGRFLSVIGKVGQVGRE